MDTSTKRGERSVASRLLEKALLPIVATAASAAASYAAKKAPDLIERKVVPKVRDMANGAGGAARDLPAKAKSATGGAGDIAEQLTERVKSVGGGARAAGSSRTRTMVSSSELDRRSKERARQRSARRKASR